MTPNYMKPAEQTLLSLVRPDSAHHEAIRHLFGLSARLEAERTRLAQDTTLSEIGAREKAAAFAKTLVRSLAELSRPSRIAKADISARRASFMLPAIDKTDVVSESKRQEIRTFIRSLPLPAKMPALEGLGDAGTLAVLDAPAVLSGLPPDRHEFLKTRYLEKLFGSQIRALEANDEEHDAVDSAATMVRKDLQDASGLGFNDFAALVKSHER